MSGELIQPTPADVQHAIDKSRCRPPNPWSDYFALGKVANNLTKLGFNPVGVSAILTPDAAKFSGCCIGETGEMPPGIYSVRSSPTFESTASGRVFSFMEVTSEKGEVYRIRGDSSIFTDDVEEI